MDRRFHCLRAGDFEAETRQCITGHQCRELLGQGNPQGMLPLKAIALVGLVHRFDDFRVAVSQGVGGPAALEIDIAVVIEVPDIIPLGPAHDHLCRCVVPLVGGALCGSGIAQAIAQVWQAPLQQRS